TSVTRLMAIPGAISTNSDAIPGSGRKPRAVLPMKLASCGCSASRKVYVRSVVAMSAGTVSNGPHPSKGPRSPRRRGVPGDERRLPLAARLAGGSDGAAARLVLPRAARRPHLVLRGHRRLLRPALRGGCALDARGQLPHLVAGGVGGPAAHR